jgi:hypothetical protein
MAENFKYKVFYKNQQFILLSPFKFDENSKSTKSEQNGCLILATSSITKICLTTCCDRIGINCNSYTCRCATTRDDTKHLHFLNNTEDFNHKRWTKYTYHTIRIARRIRHWDTYTCCTEWIITACTTWQTQIAIKSCTQWQ